MPRKRKIPPERKKRILEILENRASRMLELMEKGTRYEAQIEGL